MPNPAFAAMAMKILPKLMSKGGKSNAASNALKKRMHKRQMRQKFIGALRGAPSDPDPFADVYVPPGSMGAPQSSGKYMTPPWEM